MAYIKTTVYLDEGDLRNLEICLLKNKKVNNISGLIRNWIKNYLLKNGYEISPMEVNTTLNHFDEKEIIPQTKELHEEKSFTPEWMESKMKKIVGKVKKAEFCPHYIMIGGMCAGCGGIAK